MGEAIIQWDNKEPDYNTFLHGLNQSLGFVIGAAYLKMLQDGTLTNTVVKFVTTRVGQDHGLYLTYDDKAKDQVSHALKYLRVDDRFVLTRNPYANEPKIEVIQSSLFGTLDPYRDGNIQYDFILPATGYENRGWLADMQILGITQIEAIKPRALTDFTLEVYSGTNQILAGTATYQPTLLQLGVAD